MTSFGRKVAIRFAHCDGAGLIFYPRFLELVNEMVEDWFAGPLEHSFKTMHLDAHKGVPTAQLTAEFIRPVRLGESLEQALSVAHLGNASCRLRHEARLDGELAARFDQTLVHVDLRTMTSEPWPTPLRARMALFTESAP